MGRVVGAGGHDVRVVSLLESDLAVRRRLPRLVGSALATLVLLGAIGCGTESARPSSGEAPPAPPLSAGAPGEEELAPGWDESPDGAPPAPAQELSDDALLRLLRTRASAAAGPRTCDPEAVEASLVGFDAALGHRYTSLRVRNISDDACELEGVPGIGARGAWGSAFKLTVQPAPASSAHRGPVTLDPGQQAVALVEWTGMLAGAEDERAATLVVQLAQGEVPVPVPARLQGAPSGEPLDVGMMTTLRVSPFAPGAPDRPGSGAARPRSG